MDPRLGFGQNPDRKAHAFDRRLFPACPLAFPASFFWSHNEARMSVAAATTRARNAMLPIQSRRLVLMSQAIHADKARKRMVVVAIIGKPF